MNKNPIKKNLRSSSRRRMTGRDNQRREHEPNTRTQHANSNGKLGFQGSGGRTVMAEARGEGLHVLGGEPALLRIQKRLQKRRHCRSSSSKRASSSATSHPPRISPGFAGDQCGGRRLFRESDDQHPEAASFGLRSLLFLLYLIKFGCSQFNALFY